MRTHFAGARVSRSTDGGRNWEVLRNGLPDRMQGNIEAMALEDWGGGVSLFAATTAGEIFASDDGGDSWQLIATGLAPISKGGHYIPLMQPAALARLRHFGGFEIERAREHLGLVISGGP